MDIRRRPEMPIRGGIENLFILTPAQKRRWKPAVLILNCKHTVNFARPDIPSVGNIFYCTKCFGGKFRIVTAVGCQTLVDDYCTKCGIKLEVGMLVHTKRNGSRTKARCYECAKPMIAQKHIKYWNEHYASSTKAGDGRSEKGILRKKEVLESVAHYNNLSSRRRDQDKRKK
jgi:hypothetical protein